MTSIRLLGLAAFAVAATWAAPGFAEAMHDEAYVGLSRPQMASCQPLHFHVLRQRLANGQEGVSGYVFVMDQADTMSRISGTVAGDGRARLLLTPLHGNAPAGTIEANMMGSKLTGTMAGSGCGAFSIDLPMLPWTVAGAGG